MKNDVRQRLHGGATPSTIEFAKQLRLNMTTSEKVLWDELKEKKIGYKFRRQHPYGKYILDFYCHELRLSIEIDGEIHSSKDQKKYDNFRTSELNRCNIKELRFTNDNVKNSLEVVLAKIKKEIIRIDKLSSE